MSSLNVYIVALYILAFILGASMGSFLLVIVRRGLKGESWVKGRSVCESCGKELEWWELIPTISYLVLRGKCSKCKVKIDESHFICETYLGLVYMIGTYLMIAEGLTVSNLIMFLLIHTILWITAISDWIDQAIKVLPVYVLSAVAAISTLNIYFILTILALILMSEFLITDNMRWLGAGDIDILIAIYAITQSTLITFEALVNASIFGIILYSIDLLKKEKQSAIPFVPLLYFGYIFASLGIGLLQWRL